MRKYQEERVLHDQEINWVKKVEQREMKVREEMYKEIKALQ